METEFRLPEPWEAAMETGDIPMGRKGSEFGAEVVFSSRIKNRVC